jgi:hypothetical protein
MESDALDEQPEDSVVCDMQHVMRMMELALRNVDVAYDDENVYYAHVWNNLRGRLSCLRGAATSASWKPEFLAVLKRACLLRNVALLPIGTSLFGTSIHCVACVGKKEILHESVLRNGGFKLVGHPLSHTMPKDDFLLACPPHRLRECVSEYLHSQSCTDTSNPLYRGLFVAGPKCSRLASAFVWLQNFLPDLAQRIEDELDNSMTRETLALPPDDVSVVTKEMARFVVLQLERMETFLREGLDLQTVVIPPPLRLSPDDEYGQYTCELRNGLKRAMESMAPITESSEDEDEDDEDEDEDDEENCEDDDEDETTDKPSEADARTLRRTRRERTLRGAPRRRRAAVVYDDDDE